MPKIPGVSADEAVRALKKAGFVVLRQGKHIVMSNGLVRLTIPRHDPVNAYTMGAIAADYSKEATLSTVNPVSRMIALRVPLAISL